MGDNIFREVIHPPSGGGAELAVIADESFCLGQHVTVIDNLFAVMSDTHICDRDMFVVIRNATLEDMADTLENMMEKLKNVTVSGPGGSQAPIGFFPGTVVVAYSAKQLFSKKVDRFDSVVKELGQTTKDAARRIGALLTYVEKPIVLGPRQSETFRLPFHF